MAETDANNGELIDGAEGARRLDLSRAVDVATAMSEPDSDRRAELPREAGVDLDEEEGR